MQKKNIVPLFLGGEKIKWFVGTRTMAMIESNWLVSHQPMNQIIKTSYSCPT
jgi:hypothetical protein